MVFVLLVVGCLPKWRGGADMRLTVSSNYILSIPYIWGGAGTRRADPGRGRLLAHVGTAHLIPLVGWTLLACVSFARTPPTSFGVSKKARRSSSPWLAGRALVWFPPPRERGGSGPTSKRSSLVLLTPTGMTIATPSPTKCAIRGCRKRAILDTSDVLATGIEPLEGELAISAITLAELHFGVLVATQQQTSAERLRRLLVVERTFNALPLDEAVAASYGQIAAAVVEAGRQPRARSMDLLITATAHAHSAQLCTRNATDFEGLDNLIEVISI